MSFRQTLKNQLTERLKRNPHYSLRAFARDLQLSSARLSEILSGKKGLSRSAAASLASRLGLSAEESRQFCDEVESEHARGKVERKLAKDRIHERRGISSGERLDLDQFQLVAGWEHLALLELMRVPDYRDDLSWLSEKLGLKPIVIEVALARLERLGLCRWDDGRRVPTAAELHSPDGVPSDAIKQHHATMCDRAKEAIYFQGTEERDFFSYVLALDEKDLPKIRARVRQFVTGIDRDFGGKASSQRVYQLGSQLFALSK